MNRKGGYRRHKYHFLGLVLLGSLFFSFLIFLLACEGEYKSEAIYYFLLALPAYIAVIYCAISFFLPVKDKNYLLYSSQSTVEGLLNQNTSELIDKDNDGKILISEYYPLTEEEVLKKFWQLTPIFRRLIFMHGLNIYILLYWILWIRKIIICCDDLKVIIYIIDMFLYLKILRLLVQRFLIMLLREFC